jgi:hypothetical protein
LGLLSFTLVEVGRGAKEVVDLSAQQLAENTILNRDFYRSPMNPWLVEDC